jgi:NAD(P)-dependent dehydrogenase (short-subunit alcohol dehydrogenase family)
MWKQGIRRGSAGSFHAMQEFEGRVAVVTGGASGIGFALARRFAAEGMRVVIGDVEKEALDTAAGELAATGAEVEGVLTDVSDAAQVQALADAAIARFGAVHIACNNAGVGGGGLSWEMSLSTWEWVVGVNMWGVIHGVRSFVPLLMQQPEAHIVNTASVAGLVAAPFMGPYNASKHAVVAISETLYHELAMAAPHVKVSVLCPGWVNTIIADAARNRPAHLRDEGAPAEEGGAAILKGFLADGMAPETVADKVLTHADEGDFWVDSVNRRLESVRRRENPQLGLGGIQPRRHVPACVPCATRA